MIRAVLFDLDGVLVDACDWHYHALNEALKQVAGVTINRAEHFTTFNGLPTTKKLQILTDQGRIHTKRHKEIWEEKQRRTVSVIKRQAQKDSQKQAMHSRLRRRGLTLCCVTNSIRETAELMLSRTGQLSHMCELITNEDVQNPKPSPEGYQNVMKLLEILPREALIVEDSEKGFAAAKLSGAHVLRVRNASDVILESIIAKIDEIELECDS